MAENPSTVPLRAAAGHWMRARAASGGVSPHTRLAYERDLAAIARLMHQDLHPGVDPGDPLETLTVADLTTRNLRDAFAAYAEGRAISTLSRAHSTWRGLTGFCTQEGWLPGDPMAGIRRPRVPQGTPKPLKGGEDTSARLLEHLSTGRRSGKNPWRERDYALVATLLTTAVRASELRGLTRGDRYASGGDEYLRVFGKGNKERSVPVLPPLSAALEAYERTRQDRFPNWKPKYPDPLFVDTRNAALSVDALRWIVQTALRDAGLSSTPERQAFIHGFRHHWASLAAANGASAVEIQAVLGHASLNTSQNYIKAVAREVRATAASNPAYRVMEGLQGSD